MKQEIDNNAMWAAFRQELALHEELQVVVAAIDNALNNLGFTIEETSTIIPIPLKQGEQKPAWSEEDERQWNNIWDVLDGRFELSEKGYKNAANWFLKLRKSLRPQNTWKPSDEQMVALERGCGCGDC